VSCSFDFTIGQDLIVNDIDHFPFIYIKVFSDLNDLANADQGHISDVAGQGCVVGAEMIDNGSDIVVVEYFFEKRDLAFVDHRPDLSGLLFLIHDANKQRHAGMILI